MEINKKLKIKLTIEKKSKICYNIVKVGMKKMNMEENGKKTITITLDELDKKLKEAYNRGYNTGFQRGRYIIDKHKRIKNIVKNLYRMIFYKEIKEEEAKETEN